MFVYRWGVKITFAAAFSFLFATNMSFPAHAQCPSLEHIENKLHRLTQKKAEVKSVQPYGVPEIFEVVAQTGSKNKIFYTNMEGRYFFFGNIVDTVSGRTLPDTEWIMNKHSAEKEEDYAA